MCTAASLLLLSTPIFTLLCQMNLRMHFISLADNDKEHIFIPGSHLRVAKSFYIIHMVSNNFIICKIRLYEHV